MKIAYLILAHNTPHHLKRLIEALASDDAYFFIHLDAKSDMNKYSDIAHPHIQFTSHRTDVFWGDFSQVEATLSLIRDALQSPTRVDRLVLLSGADYPVRSREYIESHFAANPDKEFIEFVAMNTPGADKSTARLDEYRLRPKRNLVIRVIHRLLYTLRIFPLHRDHTKHLQGLIPYAGSNWWALTMDACQYVLDYCKRNPGFVKFFQHTGCSDETFFHTILGNSRFKEKIERNFTYADWSAGKASPEFISEKHLPFLTTDPKFSDNSIYGGGEIFFARKFRDDSAELVNKIIESRKKSPN
ncbi:beta-1,6-N-acetylglucosaminyltransferase [Methylovorus sp. SPW-M1]